MYNILTKPLQANKTISGIILPLIFCITIPISNVSAQPQWIWMDGSKDYDQPTVYGEKGIPSDSATPGGGPIMINWTDTSGNFWLYDSSALWKYHPGEGEWTWIHGDTVPYARARYGILGVPADSNYPGNRSFSAGWTDNDGNLWLFSGFGDLKQKAPNIYIPSIHDDVWKFDITTNQWTWLKGSDSLEQPITYGIKGIADSANTPGTRYSPFYWKDTFGNFWLYGGEIYEPAGSGTVIVFTDNLSDLWMYDPKENLWTWINGDTTVNTLPIYGTKGVFDPQNSPGARQGGISWTDDEGNFWLFGGHYFDQSAFSFNLYNDLWQYDVSLNQWAWISGSDSWDQPGIYETIGIPSLNNMPGSRVNSAGWKDDAGNFWIFGGLGYDSAEVQFPNDFQLLNDLWKYDIQANLWTWYKGSPVSNEFDGHYGTLGIPDSANTPGARVPSATWKDNEGDLWLFGGWVVGSTRNDLWKLSGTVKEPTTVNVELPKQFHLAQNYPNPFNPSTRIDFEIPEKSHVTIKIYSVHGELVSVVTDKDYEAGYYSVGFNAFGMATGVYFYKAGNFSAVKKMILVK